MISMRLQRREVAMKSDRVEKLKGEIQAFAGMGFRQERIALLANCSQPYVSQVLA